MTYPNKTDLYGQTVESLIDALVAFCECESLTYMDAHELICAPDIDAAQADWLADFIDAWDVAEVAA